MTVEEAFDKAYPEDGEQFVGNMFDIFQKGFIAGVNSLGTTDTVKLQKERDKAIQELNNFKSMVSSITSIKTKRKRS